MRIKKVSIWNEKSIKWRAHINESCGRLAACFKIQMDGWNRRPTRWPLFCYQGDSPEFGGTLSSSRLFWGCVKMLAHSAYSCHGFVDTLLIHGHSPVLRSGMVQRRDNPTCSNPTEYQRQHLSVYHRILQCC